MTTNRMRCLAALLALGSLVTTLPAHAATIVIVNTDGPGEGFNDPTPVAPVGGNPGTTLGQQRLNVFQYAASLWGSMLPSTVVINVQAAFNPLGAGVLGSAGPITIHRDFAGANFPATWYHAALANRLNGSDLSASNDINTQFSSNFNFYYGYDGNEGSLVELLPVVLHELAHGLGFSTTTSGTTGNFNGGFPSIFDRFLFDNVTGLHWSDMTPTQRIASAISFDKLAWSGPSTFLAAPGFLATGRPRVRVTSPAGIAGTKAFAQAAFGAPLTVGGVSGQVVLVQDGTAPTSDGCEPLVNAGALAGNIALVDRGLCSFVIKAAAAQAAGAIAVVIVNNTTGIVVPGGSDPSITIPVVSITQADGNAIKAQLGGGVTMTLDVDPVGLAGTDDAGRPRMYAPNPFQGGSSVSHFDVSLTPNALMEPAINTSLSDDVDLTINVFADIGWLDIPVATRLAMFVAEDRTDGIEVAWEFSDASDLRALSLERAAAQVGPWEHVAADYATDGSRTAALDRAVVTGQTYFYRLRITERDGRESTLGLVAARHTAGVVRSTQLLAASPNPAPKATTLAFRISRPEFVRLAVVDAAGRTVRTLHHGMLAVGEHARFWDGADESGQSAPAGLYFGVLVTSEGRQSSRFALVR